MGNEELRSCFKSDKVMKVRHSYGPQGHRGMSMLIFEASAVGFIEAERLSKNFEEQRRDRDAWNRYPMKFLPGGKRQLYGYMADKRDLELFDRHSPGNLFSCSTSFFVNDYKYTSFSFYLFPLAVGV